MLESLRDHTAMRVLCPGKELGHSVGGGENPLEGFQGERLSRDQFL